MGTNVKKKGNILGVGGLMMLLIAGGFDLLGVFCAILALLGVGLIFGRVVSICGFIVIGSWQFVRSGTFVTKNRKSSGKMGEATKKVLRNFLKKHWKKLGLEALPFVGDVMFSFTFIVYSELNGD